MNTKTNTKAMIISSILCSIGIIIPMFSPIKILIEPASFTLASHVAIFMAMFISPKVALFVTVGTTVGFFLGGFPLTVVARAASHIVFVSIGALYLSKKQDTLSSSKSSFIYSLSMGVIHAICEVVAVIPFYMGASLSQAYYDKGFIVSVFGLVGIGTIIHSMIDFSISKYIWKILVKGTIKESQVKVS